MVQEYTVVNPSHHLSCCWQGSHPAKAAWAQGQHAKLQAQFLLVRLHRQLQLADLAEDFLPGCHPAMQLRRPLVLHVGSLSNVCMPVRITKSVCCTGHVSGCTIIGLHIGCILSNPQCKQKVLQSVAETTSSHCCRHDLSPTSKL